MKTGVRREGEREGWEPAGGANDGGDVYTIVPDNTTLTIMTIVTTNNNRRFFGRHAQLARKYFVGPLPPEKKVNITEKRYVLFP